MDIRVDDHAEPVDELLRICEVWRVQILPSLDTMPTRHNPPGSREEFADSNVLVDDPRRLTAEPEEA